MWPWLDASGRVSPLRIAVLIGLLAPAAWMAAGFAAGSFGARPVLAVQHLAGLWAIRLLFVALAVTPLSTALGWSRLLDARRMIGVAAFVYAFAHLSLYVVEQNFTISKVATEIVLRVYLTIGFVALLGLAALAVTSTDRAMRAMGRNWRRLHRVVYVIGILAAVHFFIQSKANVGEPLMMLGFYVWLMADRLLPRAGRRTAWGLVRFAGIGAAAAVVTAFGEAFWYWFKLGAPMARVLPANFTIDAGMRPAWGVALAVGVILAFGAGRWLVGRLAGPQSGAKDRVARGARPA